MRICLLGILTSLAPALLTATASFADTPTLAECKSLEADQKRLDLAGVRQDMARGPEWVKANLPANRLSQILRYIQIDEQLRFRCQDVFAVAARAEAKRLAEQLAQQKARERALANIPPLPVRRPAYSMARKPVTGKKTPPLPVRRSR